MTFAEFKQTYPVDSTAIGWFSLDSWIEIKSSKDVEFVDDWIDNPFEHDKDYYGFMCYNTEDRSYECWYFYFNLIYGHAETVDGYKLITNTEDFGYELWNPNNLRETIENAVLIVNPNINKIKQNFKEKNRIFFTNSKELIDFIKNNITLI